MDRYNQFNDEHVPPGEMELANAGKSSKELDYDE